MRISDWSSDVCSSDLPVFLINPPLTEWEKVMDQDREWMARRMLLAGAAGLAVAGLIPAALAKTAKPGVKGLIANASDTALDRLAQPGAFYADTAVRILLPGTSGKLASKLLGAGDRPGLTHGVTKRPNESGGKGGGETKTRCRAAADNQ